MDMQKFERTANAIQFATEKLEEQLGTIEGLENLPRIVQETYKHTKQMQKARPASIIFGSLIGVFLGAAIGAFAAYHFAKPLDISSTARGVSVLYDQDGLATFYFEKNAWHGFEQDHHYVNQQMPYNGATLARKLGEKTLEALDDTK